MFPTCFYFIIRYRFSISFFFLFSSIRFPLDRSLCARRPLTSPQTPPFLGSHPPTRELSLARSPPSPKNGPPSCVVPHLARCRYFTCHFVPPIPPFLTFTISSTPVAARRFLLMYCHLRLCFAPGEYKFRKFPSLLFLESLSTLDLSSPKFHITNQHHRHILCLHHSLCAFIIRRLLCFPFPAG